MKNTTKRVRRMAYCREDDGSALDQPSDKALAREEMLVRNKDNNGKCSGSARGILGFRSDVFHTSGIMKDKL
jgi:hypothetical protein